MCAFGLAGPIYAQLYMPVKLPEHWRRAPQPRHQPPPCEAASERMPTARGADLPFVGFPCLMAANVKAATYASGGGKKK